MVTVRPLAPEDAPAAAQLHIVGQPGTFLTSLGPDVLTVLYQALPRSRSGFGFAAVEGGDDVAGFVSATTSVGALFLELGTRHVGRFLPRLAARYVRQPALAVRSVQTLLYPFLAGGETEKAGGVTAELLSIMVAPAQRGQGIGGLLVKTLVVACGERKVKWLDVTVDAENDGARRFYAQHEFDTHRAFTLYGRDMCQYRRRIEEADVG